MNTTDIASCDVACVTGASYRQVDYWCRSGLVPGQSEWVGQGRTRRWSYQQVRHVRALKALTEAGLVGQMLRDAVARLADPELDWFQPLELDFVAHVTLRLDLPSMR